MTLNYVIAETFFIYIANITQYVPESVCWLLWNNESLLIYYACVAKILTSLLTDSLIQPLNIEIWNNVERYFDWIVLNVNKPQVR